MRGFARWLRGGPAMSRREFFLYFGLLFLLVTAALIGLGKLAGENRARSHEGEEAHLGLCATKDNLAKRISIDLDRIDATVTFLTEHPKGIPGIPPEIIARGLKRDRDELKADADALRALVPVVCSPEERQKVETTTTKGAP